MRSSKEVARIGLVLPQSKQGGHFQLALSIIDSLLKYSSKFAYTVLFFEKDMLDWLTNLPEDVDLIQVKERTAFQRMNAFVNILFQSSILPMTGTEQSSKLREANLDLLVIPFHGLFGFMEEIPYIITLTSIMKKEFKHFPKFKRIPLRSRIQAGIVHRNAAKFAVISVADSPQGEDDLTTLFDVAPSSIRIIPHMPSGYIYDNKDMDAATTERIVKKYNIPERYIFYPSQLLYVKNHVRLIKALHLIKQNHGIKIPLVLAGHHEENYEEILTLVKRSGMSDQVMCLGFVSDKEIVALYKKSLALVYASLCGPTNLPPLEAMILGTPVLCPNLFLMPEQVGDAGLLFDPFSVEDIADKIYTIWTDERLREKLRKKGYERIKDMTQENYARQWEQVIADALDRIKAGTA